MNNNKEDTIHFSDLIGHVRPLGRFLLSKWYILLLAVLLGSGLGIVYYYAQKPKFEAECTFILEDKQSSLGGLGGIASQFGFDIGGMVGGGSIFSGENIFEILRSKKIVQKVLLSKVDNTQPKSPTLADLYIDFSKSRKKWENNPSLAAVSFVNAPSRLTLIEDTAINLIYDKLIKKSIIVDRVSKKGNLTKVQVSSINREFAILMAERIVEEAINLYIFIRVGNAQNNIKTLQRRADSLQLLLNGKSYGAASIQVVDANPGLAAAKVPVEIAIRDKTVIAALYSEVVKNLEVSKMLLAQQTPIIQIIDYPALSIEDNLISVELLILIGIFGALFLSCFAIFVQYIIKVNTSS